MPAQAQQDAPAIPLEHPRKRSRSITIDRNTIGERVKRFYDDIMQDRGPEIDARLQRYAKYRMWTNPEDGPWPGATNFGNPDMMTAGMKVEDTLVNATMSNRPTISAKATVKSDEEKADKVTAITDYQFYTEQNGEQTIGNLANDFVNEGLYTAYIPWIDEKRSVREILIYPMVPAAQSPQQYFGNILAGQFPQARLDPAQTGPNAWWDWKIETAEGKRFRAEFYTRDDPHDDIECELEHEAEIYCGPRVIRCDMQDILHPARCENLQIKSPSNPTGATVVLKRDSPSLDEIQRLFQDGFYDLMTAEEAEKLGIRVMDTQYQQRDEQKDIMQGQQDQKEAQKGAESHKSITRLMCFDCYDINGDGLDEDVIFWFLLEPKIVLRARYLTQMFPSNPPRRPFAEAQLFPVPGRRYAIGMLEMMEGLHDLKTQTFNQMGDAGTIANAPFGFYRSTSNVRNEVIKLAPGDLYAVSDPKNDIYFPSLGNQSQTFGFNLCSVIDQVEEKLTNIGDLQLGRVPKGKASALRTVSGMQTVLAQGDARPERVLRRFFMGLTQIWQQMHTLNRTFLPKKKQFLIAGYSDPVEDPYQTVSPDEIAGDFLFTFSANVLNTSKEAMGAALDALIGLYVTPLAIQLKIIEPDGIFRLFRDKAKSVGLDGDRYLSPPTPGAFEPPLFAEDAIHAIMNGHPPVGKPAEGVAEHQKKIHDFIANDKHPITGPDGQMTTGPGIALIDPQHMGIFKDYLAKLGQQMMAERQQQQLAAAAQQLTGPQAEGMQQPGQTQPAAPKQQQAPMQKNELQDKTLPGAGGGANPVMQ